MYVFSHVLRLWILSQAFILLVTSLGRGAEEGTCHFVYRGMHATCLGFQTSLESHFLSNICNMNFPFLGVKIFSNCRFLGFGSLIPQNKFLVIKFMTKIGPEKTYGNCFQKLKNLECNECCYKLYKTIMNCKLLMLTHFSIKIVTFILGYEICSITNILGSKFSMNPYYWVSVEPSICTTPPPRSNKPEGFQNQHLKNSMNFCGSL